MTMLPLFARLTVLFASACLAGVVLGPTGILAADASLDLLLPLRLPRVVLASGVGATLALGWEVFLSWWRG